MEVVRSITGLDAVNFMSADEPFLGFPLDELPSELALHTYTQYLNHDGNLEVTEVQDDAVICEKVLRYKQIEKYDIYKESFAGAIAAITSKYEEVPHALIQFGDDYSLKGRTHLFV
ncbi:uncharacterized protein LOC143445513 isoform X2 [Clavelina lepadiformis]|uniref:uncharacterized protein LOC143445513 isoform X2 n=1 Tax=Clavelina lepadiformis TaxID=159417 RepID=UPI0040413BDD